MNLVKNMPPAEYSAIATQHKIIRKKDTYGIVAPASSDVEYAGGEFGRDSISAAEGNLLFDPDVARRIIIARASDQGISWNYPDVTHPSTEEQPGRIIHEKRIGDVSFLRSHFSTQAEFDAFNQINQAKTDRLIEQWGQIYYGSVDATPKYITLVRDYILTTSDATILDQVYTDKNGHEKTIYQSVISAAEWVYNNVRYGPNVDVNDGQTHRPLSSPLLRFKRLNGRGIENQVLMDSEESFIFPDGKKANHAHPIADTGSQGKAYDALVFAAELLEQDKSQHAKVRAQEYRILAKDIQQNTLALWQEDQQYFAMGEDITGPIPTKCANVAELLNSGIFDDLPQSLREKYVQGITRQLFSAGSYTIVGPRMKDLAHCEALSVTLHDQRVIFDAYHDYTAVWIETNHEIVRGLQRQGLYELARQIIYATLNGVNIEGKPTEFFRVTHDGQVLYNQKQHVTQDDADFYVTSLSEEEQTWSNSAVLEFKTLLGNSSNHLLQISRLPQAPIQDWQNSLEEEIISSLQTRGLYIAQPMKTRAEIAEARTTIPHLSVNTTRGAQAQQILHERWERDRVALVSQPVVA